MLAASTKRKWNTYTFRTVTWLISVGALVISFFGSIYSTLVHSYYPGHVARHLAFTPDNQTLVGSGDYRKVGDVHQELTAWNTHTGRKLWRVVVPSAQVQNIAVSNHTVATLQREFSDVPKIDSFQYVLRLWNISSGQQVGQHQFASSESVTELCWEPDGHLLAVAFETKIALYTVTSNTNRSSTSRLRFSPPRYLPTPILMREVTNAQFTPDGKSFLVTFTDSERGNPLSGAVELWDAHTGTRLRSFEQRSTPNSGLEAVLSPDGKRLLTILQSEGRLFVWDVQTGKCLARHWTSDETGQDYLENARFGPDSVTVTALIRRQTIQSEAQTDYASWQKRLIWNTQSGSKSWQKVSQDRVWLRNTVSPNGRFSASPCYISAGPLVRLFDFQTGKPAITIEGKVEQ